MMDSVFGWIIEIVIGRSKGGKWVDLEYLVVGLYFLFLIWNLVLMEGLDNKVSKLGILVIRVRWVIVVFGVIYIVYNEVIKLLFCVIIIYLLCFRVFGLNVDFKRMLKYFEIFV